MPTKLLTCHDRAGAVYDARGVAEPTTHRSERTGPFLPSLIFYFRLDNGLEGGPAGRSTGFRQSSRVCSIGLRMSRKDLNFSPVESTLERRH